jgi:hypothetical protein
MLTITARSFSVVPFPNFSGASNRRTGRLLSVKCNRNILQDSFLANEITLWKELPEYLKTAVNIKRILKKRLTNYFVIKQGDEPTCKKN